MQDQQLERITLNPQVMVGKPVIQDTLDCRIYPQSPGPRATSAEIMAEYDGLTQEDIQACLLFAALRFGKHLLHAARRRKGVASAFWSMKAQGQWSPPGYERRDTTSSA